MAFINQIIQGRDSGRTIKVVSYDDGYEPAKAVECFKQLTGGT